MRFLEDRSTVELKGRSKESEGLLQDFSIEMKVSEFLKAAKGEIPRQVKKQPSKVFYRDCFSR